MNELAHSDRNDIWEMHNDEFRDPAEIIAYWQGASEVDPRLLEFETQGQWWDILEQCEVTMLVTREYEHLLMALHKNARSGQIISLMRIPHPSGLAVDRSRGIVYVVSTRNPNQVYDLMPVQELLPRLDVEEIPLNGKPLIPIRTRLLPGCFYLHGLALIDGELYGNSVGQNAIIKIGPLGDYEHTWWPKCIDSPNGPIFGQNYLQLNSIAAGESIETSFFSASTDEVTDVRPGDPAFPVDRRGVIFSGLTRETYARGLTRPHSACLYNGRVWVDNSGYGEVGFIENGVFQHIAQLPGWTRGLCFFDNIMFVGTSRVLPRFRQYAPGLEVDSSICGIYALDVKSGEVLGSIIWPFGNQIFDIEWLPGNFTKGFPFWSSDHQSEKLEKLLFYSFQPPQT